MDRPVSVNANWNKIKNDAVRRKVLPDWEYKMSSHPIRSSTDCSGYLVSIICTTRRLAPALNLDTTSHLLIIIIVVIVIIIVFIIIIVVIVVFSGRYRFL